MFKYLTDRKTEGGFTLVELMVVILIIAILMAVAVPVFLGARSRAQNNVAKQILTNAARAEAAVWDGSEPKAYATSGTMPNEESAYQYADAAQVAGTPTSPPTVGVVISGATNNVVTLTTPSANGTSVGTVVITDGKIGAVTGL